jgi:hypothetical protein
LAGGFIDLILPEDPIEPEWELWIDSWRNSYALLQKQSDIPLDLGSARLPYYDKAILDLYATQQEAALWILLWTWTRIATLLPAASAEATAFNNFCSSLSLDQANIANRLSALDTYLDTVEEVIENWAYQNGL